jgi:hypothetical protein
MEHAVRRSDDPTVDKALLTLQRDGVLVHSNLGKPGLESGDIDPATLPDPHAVKDGELADIYFIGGNLHHPGDKDHGAYKVVAYVIFDDDAPMAQRREAVQAAIDLCRMFYQRF